MLHLTPDEPIPEEPATTQHGMRFSSSRFDSYRQLMLVQWAAELPHLTDEEALEVIRETQRAMAQLALREQLRRREGGQP